ncbi:hypothetical protein BN1051_02094 [Arthrobacter saudimassiliensis]|uniref:General stress protein 17M-like domain-containing protein n=1 Tax=Arthrobacter saudimassiliensis TaxID=1461584 RepID=A0A078MV72_9MICC|nr:hypothetical protein BN1051_02094 [Arthrobacter saudimassiliensis]
MSNLFAAGSPRDQGRSLPRGEVVGRYTAYLDAQKAVDYLADSKFAVQNVSIVGNDLKTVERVTGRLSYPRVALSSALTGAWFGLFVGLVLSLFGGAPALGSLGPTIALGAVFWLLFGVIGYALQRGRRDFTSTSQVIATSYDVIVAPEVAGEARRLLAQLPMVGQAGHPAPQGQAGQPPYRQGQPGYGPGQPGQQPPYGQPGYGQGQPGQQPPYGQPGNGQGQPGQPGFPPQGQPQAPERPAGWQDPYAASGQGAHAAGPADAAAPAAGETRRGRFPDLPDGRPRYGVRLDAQGRPIEPNSRQSAADAPQGAVEDPAAGDVAAGASRDNDAAGNAQSQAGGVSTPDSRQDSQGARQAPEAGSQEDSGAQQR